MNKQEIYDFIKSKNTWYEINLIDIIKENGNTVNIVEM